MFPYRSHRARFIGFEHPSRALVRAVAAFVAVLLTAMAAPASADVVVADSDKTIPVSANALNFGTVCVNSTASSTAFIAAQRTGNGAGEMFANSATVTFAVQSTSTNGLAASIGTPNSVSLPGNWETLAQNTTMSPAVESTVTLATGSGTGPGSGKVHYNATGRGKNNQIITRPGELAVTWTTSNTGSCAPVPADTTPPVVTVSFATPITGQNGWFNGDDNHPVAGTVTASDVSGVAVIACHDPLGGLTMGNLVGGGTPAATRSLSVAGDGIHNINCTATDSKNNPGSATGSKPTASIKIDTTDPGLAPSATTADSAAYTSGTWTNQAVTVSFACSDTGSGVVGTYPTSQAFSDQTVNGSATQGCSDNAGNGASAGFNGINIDKTLPVLSGEITTPVSGTDVNLVDWYRTDVNVKWNASDAPSGVATETIPVDSTVNGEGSNLGAGPVTAKDVAGNTSLPASISGVHIDRNGPSISPSASHVDGTAYTVGTWTNKAVKVGYTCAEPKLADNTNGSGVATCPSSEVVNTDGPNQSVTGGSAKDIAGNTTAGATQSSIYVDGQAPQTTSQISCTGKNGWCRGQTADVILNATDQVGLSGVKEIRYSVNDGPLLTAQGASKTVTVQLANDKSGTGSVEYYAVDNAGNAETPKGVTLKYDNLAPKVIALVAPTPNSSDWNNTDVNVHFDAVDDAGGSGVDPSTVDPDVAVTSETAGTVVTSEVDDMTGNTGSASVTVKIDKTKPTATASILPGANTTKNANGWYNGPVTVHFTCSDPNGANGATGSGVASCSNPMILSADGADQGASGTAEDVAGNTSVAAVSGINIDSTPPVITINGLTQATYLLGNAPSLSCSATDATSGLAGQCGGTLSGGNASGVGTFTYRATASDLAGNTATKGVTYSVIYRWDGFLQPINDTAHQVGVTTSIFKAASTVPVKFQIKKADGTVVQLPILPAWMTPVKGSASGAAVDESQYLDPATTGGTYRWDATSQQYIYNWGTAKNQAGNYWRIGAKLDDGQVHYVNIGLR